MIEESLVPDPLSGNPSVNYTVAPTSLPQRIQVFVFFLILLLLVSPVISLFVCVVSSIPTGFL